MRTFLLVVAMAAALPLTVRADELSDLKAQLDAAMKSIQTLQKRVEALEAEKAKAEAAAVAPPAAAGAAAPAEAKAGPAPAVTGLL